MDIIKSTRQRFTFAKHSGDIMIPAKSDSPILTNDQLLVIGGWKDFTGSGGVPTMQQLYAKTLGDELFGQDAYLEGARKKDLGIIGQKIQKIRLRPKYLHIDLTKNEQKNI